MGYVLLDRSILIPAECINIVTALAERSHHMDTDKEQSVTGLVFDIQRFSIHDGPGIRTTVFLKGCSLRCFWCHNPESIRPRPEIQFYPERCIQCGACLSECPNNACLEVSDSIQFDRNRCQACGDCQSFCFSETLVLIGREISVSQVMAEIQRDQDFYIRSGGGVTLSGGEPVLQTAFTRALLRHCQNAGIHTAIETAGNYHWNMLAGLLPYVDLVMMDIKHMDPVRHQAAVGVTNERILGNARQLAETNIPILFRTPVVPTVNDTPAEVETIAHFAHECIALRRAIHGRDAAPINYELLKFHKMASDKYQSLGMRYAATDLEPLSPEDMDALNAVVAQTLDAPATKTKDR